MSSLGFGLIELNLMYLSITLLESNVLYVTLPSKQWLNNDDLDKIRQYIYMGC